MDLPIREQLVALREKRGLSQRAVALRVGVTQPVIADFEKQPGSSLRLAMKVAEALDAEIKVVLIDKLEKKPRRAA